jgi:LemA protein
MTTWIVIGVVVFIVVIAIGIYNRLVGLRQNVRQALGDIDAQLRQRHDLVPNLIATVKGYAAHEQATFDSVIAARNSAAGASTPEAEAALTKSLSNLLALGEAYPDLKASANFQALQGELADVEDKLAAARRSLNASVANYNTARESFPAVLVAAPLGFQQADFHLLAVDERSTVGSVPNVQF